MKHENTNADIMNRHGPYKCSSLNFSGGFCSGKGLPFGAFNENKLVLAHIRVHGSGGQVEGKF